MEIYIKFRITVAVVVVVNITVLIDYCVNTQYLIRIKISDITTKTLLTPVTLRVKMAK